MMKEIVEMAERLGKALGGTEEYRALRRAITASGDDRELTELQTKIRELEQAMEARLRKGEEPTDEEKESYEKLFSGLQSNVSYQHLVAAQTNFDKVIAKVNQTIHDGLEKGAESRIILT
jgi:cell fate (sporulation/competence/biofilm development) regulator YlbF (YheA/YmcA/DUF963 family)